MYSYKILTQKLRERETERYILIWVNNVKVLNYWEGLCKSKRWKVPSNETPVSCYRDPLMKVKFQYFAFIANILAEYLITLQSDSPLVPFLSGTTEKQYCRLCEMVIKREVLDLPSTTLRLLEMVLNDKENRLKT